MQGDAISADVSRAISGLEDMEKKLARKGIRQSLRASAKPTLSVAKSSAPEASGLLKRNTKLRSLGVKQGTYSMAVGVGKKWFTGPTFYAAFVAFGHHIGRRELGDARKMVEANNWIERAYEETKSGAIGIFEQTIIQFIESNT